MSTHNTPSDAALLASFNTLLGAVPKGTAKAKPAAAKKPVAPAPYVIPQLHLQRPDALVLCILTTECISCSSTFSHPSPHLMVRRGRHIHATHQSIETLSTLPREHTTVTNNSRMCPNCFNSTREVPRA